MRKIDRQVSEAVHQALNFKGGNTVVSTNADNISEVRFHGNLIARVGETWAQLFDGGQQSKTVKSRLNAIICVWGDHLFQKGGVWFIETSKGETIPFRSGMLME